jgi:type II secretory pathway pseudopilin PulG
MIRLEDLGWFGFTLAVVAIVLLSIAVFAQWWLRARSRRQECRARRARAAIAAQIRHTVLDTDQAARR